MLKIVSCIARNSQFTLHTLYLLKEYHVVIYYSKNILVALATVTSLLGALWWIQCI